MTVTSKRCVRCEREKTAAEFHRSKTGTGGLHGYCKQCQHTFYEDRKAKLIQAGLCIVCAMAAPEEGRPRCEGCRLRQNFDANQRYVKTRSKRDSIG